MQLESMYQEIILDHYRTPHHKGLREPYDVEVHHVNPTCGDEITLRVKLDGDTVTDVSYDSAGCSISQASASVLTDLVIGRDIETGLVAHREFVALMQSKGLASPTRRSSRTRSRSPASRSTPRGSSARCCRGWPGRTRPHKRARRSSNRPPGSPRQPPRSRKAAPHDRDR